MRKRVLRGEGLSCKALSVAFALASVVPSGAAAQESAVNTLGSVQPQNVAASSGSLASEQASNDELVIEEVFSLNTFYSLFFLDY